RKPDITVTGPHKQSPGRSVRVKETGANGCAIAGRPAASVRASCTEVPTNNPVSVCHQDRSTGRVRNTGAPFQIARQNNMVPCFAALDDGVLWRTQVAIRQT